MKSVIKTEKNKPLEPFMKFLTDFVPIIVFFSVYKLSSHPKPIIPATIYLVIISIVALTISYIYTRKIAKMPLISACLLGIFGGFTIFSGNDIFIKMKPTILNTLFSLILFVGYFMQKPLLEYLFDGAIKMSHKAWMSFSLRWAVFFLLLAILNEFIWRNFSTDFWVQFKVFGMLPLSIIFAIINMPFIMRETSKTQENTQK